MPLYEYKCTRCGHRFERIQSFSAEDVKACPVCEGAVERLISAPVAHFRGSGFYSTDYAAKPAGDGKASKAKDSGESAASGAPASGAEPSAPAKAAKTESSAASGGGAAGSD
jgi:putative FmdB family regulatory protein